VPVWHKTYVTDGVGSFFGSTLTPGDCAALIRYTTDQVSVRNHPIYLFNYYHGVRRDLAGDADDVNSAQLTAYEEYGTDWLDGYSDGVNTYLRAGPRGATALTRLVHGEITHRDFPR
jgi:hypothetical protein